jgi:L,D-transpeptidase ErfK/SrfK
MQVIAMKILLQPWQGSGDTTKDFSLSLCLAAALFMLPLKTSALTFPLPAKGGDVVGEVQTTYTHEGDSFVTLSDKYNVGYHELREANPGVELWTPHTGTKVVIPTRFILPAGKRNGIVINISELRLYFFAPTMNLVATYPIGIGKMNWLTPTGTTTVVKKVKDPGWTVPDSIWESQAARGNILPRYVPPGPDNPLGKYALRLGISGYLIHGTNSPSGIGMRVSHGCIRMNPEDIEELFTMVSAGTPVRIVHNNYDLGWENSKLLLEVRKPLSEFRKPKALLKKEIIQAIYSYTGQQWAIVDWAAVDRAIDETRGVPEVIGIYSTSASVAPGAVGVSSTP